MLQLNSTPPQGEHAFRNRRRNALDHTIQQLGKIDLLEIELRRTILQMGKGQQILDEESEPAAVLGHYS